MPENYQALSISHPDSTWALAQFLKRSRWENFLARAVDEGEAHQIKFGSAGSKLRRPGKATHLDEPGRRRRACLMLNPRIAAARSLIRRSSRPLIVTKSNLSPPSPVLRMGQATLWLCRATTLSLCAYTATIHKMRYRTDSF